MNKPILALALLLALPQLAWAERHYYRYHDRPHVGVHVSIIPTGYISVRSSGGRYYYYDGIYYNRSGREYVVVNPPVGAVVTTVPVDYRPIIINGTTYYTDNGIYYVYTRHGYQVVAAPTAASNAQTFTVNVPNDRGGYTAVKITRSGNGFTGPQGEFYPEFPKVARLKVVYGHAR